VYTCVHAGGTFALYSLLRQHVNFSGKSVPVPVTRLASDANLRFHSRKSSQQPRMLEFLEGSAMAQAVITYLVLVGTCMVMGDGALTPSISGTVFTSSSLSSGHYCILIRSNSLFDFDPDVVLLNLSSPVSSSRDPVKIF
jgi:KUP system potassium uptake protein